MRKHVERKFIFSRYIIIQCSLHDQLNYLKNIFYPISYCDILRMQNAALDKGMVSKNEYRDSAGFYS